MEKNNYKKIIPGLLLTSLVTLIPACDPVWAMQEKTQTQIEQQEEYKDRIEKKILKIVSHLLNILETSQHSNFGDFSQSIKDITELKNFFKTDLSKKYKNLSQKEYKKVLRNKIINTVNLETLRADIQTIKINKLFLYKSEKSKNGVYLTSEKKINEIVNYQGKIIGNGSFKTNKNTGVKEFTKTFQDEGFLPYGYKLEAVGRSHFTYSSKSRIRNIDTAIEKINGKIIKPGEIFSTVNTLKPFTYKNGYVDGYSIINGKEKKDIAGGVCQTSTTLFRAFYNAGMEAVEFRAHSISYPSYYGNDGRDATIYNPHPDMKFKNNTPYPIYIEMIRKNNNVMVLIYGKNLPNTTMKHISHSENSKIRKNKWKRDIFNKKGEIIKTDSFNSWQKKSY